MKARPRRLSAGCVSALLVLAIGTAPSAAVRPPKLVYELTALPNGLTVALSEDHSTPIVHLNLTYHVGSKNEKPGRTGFAHLFEHLMFKGSKNVQPEAHASLVASVGGQSNAYTTDDETVFWETVPAQYLPMILWLEADRMATLRIDKDTFTNERQVVKEERRMRVDNQPYGRLNEIIYDQAFAVHPYKHATIGSMADLEAASIDDVRDFYRTYYVPSNATLVLVGDFDTAQAQQFVAQYLGRLPRAERSVPGDIPRQPPHTTEQAADALIAELDRLKAEPITEHELQRAKNQFARDYIVGRESNQSKASQLAHAVVVHHDITTADGEFDIFQTISAADV